ncbi:MULTISPECIES: bifunctional glutamate N-acetyltransferase/amino-acid acetyltransferase ArgJ [unclassified Streptomyces]|uniref:bifunctional glutamate N-acetyltransferase/amino-acid acetyltransferase ArgJ n=1 Tax=unclassified Streptomyces TaxID=2593676 RepID=UPI000DBA2CA6|nr:MULTISPECIES: bifunctional glutamate N-acetyltransferase/amino-acid acetyltransferase ArgJ [Streptomyces]MYU02513.1 bifunctional glutamate N-acetyltransferase/amino-acid acetyltransferase ArgJ [Streptomyces sp. SID8366]MYU62144.1 bifunctional glutamate N-acetyltransferase/amino-acid acetyltransferase ArgJ [Streptomyces sp. SID69]RAJ55344.1 glutamate N-acetyltransferase [Streptomyces sp. PsTaAH-130]TXJ71640.1 bifunctional glutamate N-acetyltransferase/amino-acid acetyltransferase ArgJ [Strept
MSVTAAKGFRAAGIAAGIKQNGNPDLALVVNDGPRRAAAGVFTANRVKAAPVLWSEQVVKSGQVSAVVLNSGGANACTGPQGFQDTHATAEKAGEVLGRGAIEVAVCSTGLIGVLLPMDKLLPGIGTAAAQLSEHGGEKAAIAIKTTDTVHKTSVVSGDGWTVGGMAKGAGMLAPGLATMLVVITTDADVDDATLEKALRAATKVTFDRVDSDGCMSTNDTVLLLSSGASGVTPAYDAFAEAVRQVCDDLGRQLIGDAEGASKDIKVEVVGAASEADAVEVGRSIARNNLLKCALHGEDPNWGRVLSAIGTTGAVFEPDQLNVAINGVWVCKNGSVGEDRDLVDMRYREVHIVADLAAGAETATIWTNDLTADYVHENSAYSS